MQKSRTAFFLFILIFYSLKLSAQSELATDSLLSEMCKTISKSKKINDSTRYYNALEKHIFPLMDKLSEVEQSRLYDYVFFRLQRQCKDFFYMLAKAEENKGDWEQIDKKPVTKLTKAVCNEFNTRKNYYYFESSTDTVNVVVENGLWIEEYNDGTYSKCKFSWVADCEFELEFVSSNNHIKKNLSVPGDKYRYQLLEKIKNYYFTSAEVVGLYDFSTFKIYIR